MVYIDTSKVTIPKGFFNDLNVPKLLKWLNSQPAADVVPRAEVEQILEDIDTILLGHLMGNYDIHDTMDTIRRCRNKYIKGD